MKILFLTGYGLPSVDYIVSQFFLIRSHSPGCKQKVGFTLS